MTQFTFLFMTKFIAAVCLFFGWMLPDHFYPWISWQNELLPFFAVFLLSWYGLIKKEFSGSILVPAATCPFLTLGLIAVIQGVTGNITFSGDAFVFALYISLCVMCITLGFTTSTEIFGSSRSTSTRQERSRNVALEYLACLLLIGALASAVVAFAQVLGLWDESSLIIRMPSRRPGGNIGQPNHLATLLLMGVISLLYLYESGLLKVWSSGLILPVLAFALASTESRTIWLSFLLLMAWWFAKQKKLSFRLPPWMALLTGIVFFTLFWWWPSFLDLIHLSGINVGSEKAVSTAAGMRLVMLPQLLEAVAQRPWWGWGIREIAAAHNAVAHAYPVSEAFTYSHNIVLDLALGIGLPLTVLFLVVIGIWLWFRIRGVNNLSSWYCLAMILPFALHSMLEFPFAYAYFLAPVMFALGALEKELGSKFSWRIGVSHVAGLLLVTSILAIWSVVEYVEIEEDFRVARFEALRIGQTPESYERPHVFLLTQLNALLNGARIVPKPGMTMEELELARKVALRYPWAATQNRYALSLALNGNRAEALRQLQVMRAMEGEVRFSHIREYWQGLAQDKYPQLQDMALP